MNATHPIHVGTEIRYTGRSYCVGNYLCWPCRSTVVACDGQLGTNRVWWYRLADGRRVSEYAIDDVFNE